MTPLQQSLAHPANTLRDVLIDLYPDVHIVRGRCKAVWRGGDGLNVAVNSHTLHDFTTGETYTAFTLLTQIAGYSPADAARYLISRAGLDDAAPKVKTAHRTRRASSDAQAERTKAQRQAEALRLQRTGPTTGSSAYFQCKGISGLFDTYRVASAKLPSGETVPGLVYSTDERGAFVQLVLRDLEGIVTGFQRIYDDPGRRKKFVYGSRPKRSFVLLEPLGATLPRTGAALAAQLKNGAEVALCEGFATGASIALARPRAFVFCALSAGNLGPVASALRVRHGYQRRAGQGLKALDLCIWGDLDESQTGQRAAHRAALQSGCYVRLPRERGDFNDLAQQRGLEAVRRTRKTTPDPAQAFGKELSERNLSAEKHLAPLELPDPGAALIIRAPQESGKTHRISELLDGTRLSVLVVTHRESLARNLAARLKFECYTDYSAHLLSAAPRLVICFDSLQKLVSGGKLPHYDVLLLDESEQLLEHATSRHIKHKAANFGALEALLRDTPRVICADANAGRLTADTLHRYAPARRIVWHRHEHEVAAGRQLRLAFSRDDVLDSLEGEQRPAWLASDSLRFTRDVDAYLNDPDTLTINSETANTDAAQAYLKDPTGQAKTHRRMIASPSVQTGLSDDSGHWQHVLGVFSGVSSTPQDALQALMRARRVSQLTVYTPRRRGEAVSVSDALEGAAAVDAHEGAALGQDSYGAQNPNYERLTAEVTAKRSRGQANYREHLALGAARLGYTVKVDLAPDLTPAKVAARAERRAALKQAGLERYISDRVAAERITPAQAQVYSDAYSLTQSQHFALEQFQVRQFYRIPSAAPDAELAELLRVDDYERLRRQIEHYENLVQPRAVAEARARGDLEGGVLRGDSAAHMLRFEYHRHLGAVIGLDAENEARAENWQTEQGRLEGELHTLRSAAETARTRRKGELLKQIARLETDLAAHRLQTFGRTYSADSESVRTFVRWCCKHYRALKHAGIVSASPADLKAKPLETIGDSLRRAGLEQQLIKKSGSGMVRTYALQIGSVSMMFNYSRHRRENWHLGQQNNNKKLLDTLLPQTAECASGTGLIIPALAAEQPPDPDDPAQRLTQMLEQGRLDAFGPRKVEVIRQKLDAGDTPWLHTLATSATFDRMIGGSA